MGRKESNLIITFTESVVEEVALGWLEDLGWAIVSGADVARGRVPTAHKEDWGEREK